MHIKIITCLFTTMIFFSLPASITAGSDAILWTYSKESSTLKTREIITYAVSSQISSITRDSETIFIDYEQLRLHRYRNKDGSCDSFNLNNSAHTNQQSATKEEITQKMMRNLLGSFKVIDTDERRLINKFNCLEKHILFAHELSLSQMIISPVIEKLGQEFTESMVTYWVTRDIAGFDSLYEIARRNKKIYEANPLLRQIDMLGLIEILEGFPIKINKQIQKDSEIYTLLSFEWKIEENELLILPKKCQ